MASGCVRMMEAGQRGETGPSSVSRTAQAFLTPGTMQTREREDINAGMVSVKARCGTSSKAGNSPSLTCCWRQTTSKEVVRTQRGSAKSASWGSLKAMCPFSPIPRLVISTLDESFVAAGLLVQILRI